MDTLTGPRAPGGGKRDHNGLSTDDALRQLEDELVRCLKKHRVVDAERQRLRQFKQRKLRETITVFLRNLSQLRTPPVARMLIEAGVPPELLEMQARFPSRVDDIESTWRDWQHGSKRRAASAENFDRLRKKKGSDADSGEMDRHARDAALRQSKRTRRSGSDKSGRAAAVLRDTGVRGGYDTEDNEDYPRAKATSPSRSGAAALQSNAAGAPGERVFEVVVAGAGVEDATDLVRAMQSSMQLRPGGSVRDASAAITMVSVAKGGLVSVPVTSDASGTKRRMRSCHLRCSAPLGIVSALFRQHERQLFAVGSASVPSAVVAMLRCDGFRSLNASGKPLAREGELKALGKERSESKTVRGARERPLDALTKGRVRKALSLRPTGERIGTTEIEYALGGEGGGDDLDAAADDDGSAGTGTEQLLLRLGDEVLRLKSAFDRFSDDKDGDGSAHTESKDLDGDGAEDDDDRGDAEGQRKRAEHARVNARISGTQMRKLLWHLGVDGAEAAVAASEREMADAYQTMGFHDFLRIYDRCTGDEGAGRSRLETGRGPSTSGSGSSDNQVWIPDAKTGEWRRLTGAQAHSLRRVFDRFDVRGGNKISAAELYEALRSAARRTGGSGGGGGTNSSSLSLGGAGSVSEASVDDFLNERTVSGVAGGLSFLEFCRAYAHVALAAQQGVKSSGRQGRERGGVDSALRSDVRASADFLNTGHSDRRTATELLREEGAAKKAEQSFFDARMEDADAMSGTTKRIRFLSPRARSAAKRSGDSGAFRDVRDNEAPRSRMRALRVTFDKYDNDGDGMITVGDLRVVFGKMGRRDVGEEELESWVSQRSASGDVDRGVSFEDFVRANDDVTGGGMKKRGRRGEAEKKRRRSSDDAGVGEDEDEYLDNEEGQAKKLRKTVVKGQRARLRAENLEIEKLKRYFKIDLGHDEYSDDDGESFRSRAGDDELAEIRAAFDRFDGTGSGKISARNVSRFIRSIGFSTPTLEGDLHSWMRKRERDTGEVRFCEDAHHGLHQLLAFV